MLRDFAISPLAPKPPIRKTTRFGSTIETAEWTPEALQPALEAQRDIGKRQLLVISDSRLIEVWEATIEEFLNPDSDVRAELSHPLANACALSEQGLQAGLEAVLGGMRGDPLRRLVGATRPSAGASVTAVVLSSNLPALAVQSLLPALSLRQPLILKSPSAEPLFAPAFVRELVRHEPMLANALLAITWTGGRDAVESEIFAVSDRVLAYGTRETMDSLGERLGERLVAFGPKISFAVADGDRPDRVAPGVARDIALFDQRGCLSVHAVYTFGAPRALARAIAEELSKLASRWPPGRMRTAELASVRQLRADAELRRLYVPSTPIEVGTVIAETEPALSISPGLRTVRVYPLPSEATLLDVLAPWRGRLQGAALHGPRSRALGPSLGALGVSRITDVGELQSTDALWHNGGVDPLEAVARRSDFLHPTMPERPA